MLRKLQPTANFIHEVWTEFNKDKGSLFAAAISFFGVTSMIPLIMLAVGIFGHVIGSREDALQRVLTFISDFIPVGIDVLDAYLRELSKESSLLSWIGLAGLMWAGMQVFVIIQQVMNVALGSVKHISFVRGRVIAILLVLVAGALFVLSIVITSLVAAARHYHPEILGVKIGALDIVWRLVVILVPMFISTLAFTFIYRFTPTESIGYRGPIIGGVTAGLLFEIAKNAFKWYVTHIANYSVVYGSLGSIIVLVVWTYYVSLITVLGAEVASVYARMQGEYGISDK